MQTQFDSEQLQDTETSECATAIRKCVHCGFCQATCPTYVLLGDELDSPRGRIMLIKNMLEQNRPATEREVRHIDRCLSCLACTSTCPSGVNYRYLIDKARVWIEETYRRPLFEHALRSVLARTLPQPKLFRAILAAGILFKPIAGVLPKRLAAMFDVLPRRVPKSVESLERHLHPAHGIRRARVALLLGCAQSVLGGHVHLATIQLLNRLGVEVVLPHGQGCCGALNHHMGRESAAKVAAKANLDSWSLEHQLDPLDAIIVNASGCGTSMKDYARLLRSEPNYHGLALEMQAKVKDISEFLLMFEQAMRQLSKVHSEHIGLKIAYQAACSLQHGQQVKTAPKQLLEAVGYQVMEPREPHLCCGSAGTYNLLQISIAQQLKQRKKQALSDCGADFVASGNVGCINQLGGEDLQVVHTVELLNWACGGDQPAPL